MWYDRRLDPGNLLIDVYTAQSLDGGHTFGPNERVTDVSFGLPAWLDPYVDCYMGDYNSLVGTASAFHLVWGDNRNLNQSGDPQPDVYTDTVAAGVPLVPTATPTPVPFFTPTPDATPGGSKVHDTAATELDVPNNMTVTVPPGSFSLPVSFTVENQGSHPEGEPAKAGDGVLASLFLIGLPFECVTDPGFNYFYLIDAEATDLAAGAEATMDLDVEVRCKDRVPSGLYSLAWLGFASSPAHGDTPMESQDDDPKNNMLAAERDLRIINEDIPYGDGNCSGGTDSIDALFILQLTAGLVPFLGCEPSADVNEDFLVDPIDAALILQYAAGLIDELPV
jgi:hypothetical protein